MGARPARRHRGAVPAAPRGPGARRLPDPGDAAAARPRARAGPRRVRDLRRRLPAGGDGGRQTDRDPVRSEEGRNDRLADRAARGRRGAEQRLQHRPHLGWEWHAGLYHRRHAGHPARRLGQPRGVRDRGGSTWDPQGIIGSAALSPDGKAIAVALTREGRRDIWVKRLPAGPFSRLTFNDTSSGRPAWSADGKDVYYIADRSGSGVGPVYARRSDGTGAPRLVARADVGHRPGGGRARRSLAPAPDRARAARHARHPRGAAGDTTPVPLVASRRAELFPALSPDGRWLAYASDESGALEVYVRPFPETAGAKWQVSTAGGSQPTWSSTGRELLYVNGKNDMVAAQIPRVRPSRSARSGCCSRWCRSPGWARCRASG